MINHIPQRGDILADADGNRHMLCITTDGRWLTVRITGSLAGFTSFKEESAVAAIEQSKLFPIEN